MLQTNKQNNYPQTNLNGTKINELPRREFKMSAITMPTEVKTEMHEQCEDFNRKT